MAQGPGGPEGAAGQVGPSDATSAGTGVSSPTAAFECPSQCPLDGGLALVQQARVGDLPDDLG